MKRGSLVVGQSGGATAVTNATLAGVIDAGRQSAAFTRIIGLRDGLTGLLEGRHLDLTTLPQQTVDLLRQTPSAALGSTRHKFTDDELATAFENLQRLDTTILVLIGGNDSADSALRLQREASRQNSPLRVILAPKTVDNDLPDTDHTPGYGSMARFLANYVRDATFDSLALPALMQVKVIEVMGRDAGWVAATGGLAFGVEERDIAPLIYLPERAPESVDQLLDELDDRVRSRGFVVAVMPETLRTTRGVPLGGVKPLWVDPFGHPYHESPASAIVRSVTERLKFRARYEKPGSAARMSVSMASPVDQAEAYEVGQSAVECALKHELGKMVRIIRVDDHPYRSVLGLVELERVANLHRPFPDIFIASESRSASEAFRRYALPLLGNDPFPQYVRLPQDARTPYRIN